MATATTPHIPVEEYLNSVYHPDCDYVDGITEKRNAGEIDHGTIQARLARVLGNLLDGSGFHVMTEVRMQVQKTRFRVPDVMVTRGKPSGQIVSSPPLLCIEVLSSEDRISRVNTRIQEYLDFGVPVVWLVEPTEKRLWIYRSESSMQEASGSVMIEGIEVPFSDIFD